MSAQELEELVHGHLEVVEAAAIGVPSALTEEEIKGAVLARPGSGLDAPVLARWLAGRVPRFMTGRYVEVVGDLPRTETQKVTKGPLRAGRRTPATWDAEEGRFLGKGAP